MERENIHLYFLVTTSFTNLIEQLKQKQFPFKDKLSGYKSQISQVSIVLLCLCTCSAKQLYEDETREIP